MNIVKQEKEQLVIETSLVASETGFKEKLLFGEAPPEGWAAGEHALIDFLRSSKAITKGIVKDAAGGEHEQPHVDVYSDEAQAVVDLARSFFGNARSLGPTGRTIFKSGELVMVLKPEKIASPVAAPELAEEAAPPKRRGASS